MEAALKILGIQQRHGQQYASRHDVMGEGGNANGRQAGA